MFIHLPKAFLIVLSCSYLLSCQETGGTKAEATSHQSETVPSQASGKSSVLVATDKSTAQKNSREQSHSLLSSAPTAQEAIERSEGNVPPPRFDEVSVLVKRMGNKTKCNDLNGCPLVNALVSMGADAAPAIQSVFGKTRGDDHWRLRLLEALGRMRHPEIPGFLKRVAKSATLQPMRVQALLSLARQGDKDLRKDIESLKSQFHPEKHRAELLAIGFAVAALGDKETGKKLIRKHFIVPPVPTQYRRWDLLRPGVYAIGQLRMNEYLPQLEDISERADPFVRREAVRALSALRNKKSIPALVKRLDDEVPGVRMAAVRALQTLTGLYNNKAPNQWRRWWRREQERGTVGSNKPNTRQRQTDAAPSVKP